MKRFTHFLIALFLSLSSGIFAQTEIKPGALFDFGWRFHQGGAQRAEQPEFDDSNWRKVDLPHDWSIEDRQGTESPFDRDAISQVNGGFTTGGTGWYRKTFSVPEEDKDKIITILFEGVYMNSDVWLNGSYIGTNPYGYTSFWFDITSKVRFGKKNVLAVKVKNEGENSRWYPGSGIYRHVWLKSSSPIHIAEWGTFVSTPEVKPDMAKAGIQTTLTNQSSETAEIRLITKIRDTNGTEIGKAEATGSIGAGSSQVINQSVDIKSPVLWSTETPILYTAYTEVYLGSALVDKKETRFGIRTISFDAATGFLLNGKPLKLKGGCVHHDNGPLGAKAYDRAEERRVELLKASGYNAIRCAHNPPSPAFLDACDRLGMLVIDEAFDMWSEPKNPNDYHLYFRDWWQRDMSSMVLRDRNHPSVILWSIGNEIPNRHTPEVANTAKTLADYIRQLDPTRPVTSAVNDVKDDKDAYFSALDVAGYNYAPHKYTEDHNRKPQRIIVATESYPLEAFDYWMAVLDNVYVIGDFVWTSFDYIGEASIGWRGYWQNQDFYPWNLAFCGDIDICGWKRPQSFYRDALWKENQISIFVKPPKPSFEENPDRQEWSKWHWLDAVADWNWAGYENQPLEVTVYSSCEQVELFLNGKSLGKKPTNRSTRFMASWQVPYQTGTLKATGYQGKKQVSSSELKTAKEASQMALTCDRNEIKANGQDLAYITVELKDANGVRNPKAENLVKFEVEGPGTLIAVGNANPMSLESCTLPKRKAWQGKCLVIIKSESTPGKITLKARSEGLPTSSVELTSVGQ